MMDHDGESPLGRRGVLNREGLRGHQSLERGRLRRRPVSRFFTDRFFADYGDPVAGEPLRKRSDERVIR
jgi:hypothetical protein